MFMEFKPLAGSGNQFRMARGAILLCATLAASAAVAQGHPFSPGHPIPADEIPESSGPEPPELESPELESPGLESSGPEPRVSEVTPLWLQNPWTGDTRLVRVPEPDQSLWNATRIDDYEIALAEGGTPPLALLTINRLGVKVPVYNGTDEFNLDRGLGRIQGMARIHEDGHLGISGHRDGFFRVLKDIQAGDRIMLRSAARSEIFEVQDFNIVDKHDDRILHEKSDERRLTLVTCYPFYYVGSAPQRFIVHAMPLSSPGGQAGVSTAAASN